MKAMNRFKSLALTLLLLAVTVGALG